MAKATTEVVVTEVKNYTLELSEDEAQMLIDVLSLVSGPLESRRRHADQIFKALRKTGLDFQWGQALKRDVAGDIRFKQWLKCT